ncbi:FliM/FliN family flagellar motor C-terminal domain-containing protein [Hyphomonas sp.]|uniref:FliM/FliN family flagellar motor C-terminal domain-containing protein n=1 Tax=Hyphomonas sp. TaxID=87 RepID=UPI0025BD3750|nr:FliM/FliN family flagellar motor C-terminal domain-containing protein [Hyphomonas sp.]
MKRAVRSWLPEAAIFDGALQRRLEEFTADWSRKWCQSGRQSAEQSGLQSRLRLVPAEFGLPGAPGAAAWMSPKSGVHLIPAPKSRLVIARAMLGLKQLPKRKAASDLALIDALEEQAVGDFLSALSGLVPECRSLARANLTAALEPEDGKDGRGLVASVELKPHGALFDMFIRSDLACAARRSLVTARRAPRPLGSLGDALGAQDLAISARAGRGTLTLTEFSGLGEGDILILDRTIASGLEVLVNGRAISGARCEIGDTVAGPCLRIIGVEHAG